MNVPHLPNVPIPGVKKKQITGFSLDSSAINHSRTRTDGDDYIDEEQAVNRSGGFGAIGGLFKEEGQEAKKERTAEEKEKETLYSLEEDLYSLMYLCRPISITMLVAVSVFTLQIFILALILADLTSEAPVYPEVVFFPLEVPIKIKTTVAVAQCVSLIVATIKEEDIFVSLKALIVVGHDERVSVRFPGATPTKWWLANIFRFITGLGNVIVSFYFIVGSDNVLDIFESFAALEFVSYIDNMVFKLARWGYTGKMLQRMTIKVESVQMENRRERGRWWIVLTILFLSLTIIPLLSLWTLVFMAQNDGFYLEKSISSSVVVRFGTEAYVLPKRIEFMFNGTDQDLSSFDQSNPPELQYSFFSGSYKISYENGRLDTLGDRPIYFERNATLCTDDPTCGMFYYCEAIGTWVYTIRALGTARKELDKCKWGWIAQSKQTEVYSLEDVPDSEWKVFIGVVKDTTVSIESDSCDLDSDCSLNGICEEGICNCFEDWQGRRCDVAAPFCPAIAFVDYGKSSYEYEFVVSYELGKNIDETPILVYDRPIYFRTRDVPTSTCPSGILYQIYLYPGRRWVMTDWCQEKLVRYLDEGGVLRMEENLHAFWDNILGLEIKWFSETTESYTGIGLPMYQMRDSYSSGGETGYGVYFLSDGTFECMDVPCADNPGVCGRKGTCEQYRWQSNENATITSTFNKCTCSDYYGGVFCQFNPYGDYAREHFEAFLSNETAALEPTPYEYQSRYWQPLLAAGIEPPPKTNLSAVLPQFLLEGVSTGGGSPTAIDAATNSPANVFNRSISSPEGEL